MVCPILGHLEGAAGAQVRNGLTKLPGCRRGSESSEGAIVTALRESDLKGMAAAPGLVVGESLLASPELALVDADLRQSLCAVEYTWMRRRAILQGIPAAIEDDAPVQGNLADESAEAASGDPPDVSDYQHRAELIEEAPEQSERTSSHYPELPASKPEEGAIDETDVALRRIRERLADESPATTRKLRRLFTLASGATTLCALSVLAVDIHFQVAQF